MSNQTLTCRECGALYTGGGPDVGLCFKCLMKDRQLSTPEANATKLPWKFHPSDKHNLAAIFGGEDEVFIATCHPLAKAYGNDEANAALIVSAVNSHDALVAERDQLKAALEAIVNHKILSRHFDHSGFMNATQLSERDEYLRLVAIARLAIKAVGR